MKLILLRHGETEYNAQKRYQGTRDIPLSEAGRAALCAAPFSAKTVYVSPLVRTVQTAEILFPQAELVTIPDFREMCFGSFEGRNYIDMEQDEEYFAWVQGNCTGQCPDGESREQFTKRTCAAFAALVDKALARGEQCITIVAHGGTQMAILSKYAVPRAAYHTWCAENAGGYLCSISGDSWRESRLVTVEQKVSYARQ